MHIFALSIALFQVANAALLPVALNGLTRLNAAPPYLVPVVVVLPQIIVAAVSPTVGALTERWGRRPLLLAGFAAVPLRAMLIALFPGAWPLIVLQALDGISGTVLGLMLPLVAADLTKDNGFLNLAIGALGLASGLGAAFSTIFAGAAADAFGSTPAFLALAGAGICAVALLTFAMPETRPRRAPRQSATTEARA